MHPGVAFVVSLALAAAAEHFVPLPLFHPSHGIDIGAFGVLFVAGLSLWAWGFHTLRKAGTPVEPGEPATRLVVGGPFRWTRNPLYVALLLASLSFTALANSVWFLLATLVLFPLLHFGVIRPEERYLAGRFGEEFLAYTRRVRRWL